MPPATIIDGRRVAAGVRERVAAEVSELRAGGVEPGLATVLVGEDPASEVYVRMKRKACAEVGIESFHHPWPPARARRRWPRCWPRSTPTPAVSGILLQLPLPARLDAGELTAAIDPGKDVDGLTPVNAGLLAQGGAGLVPCTPAGVMELLADAGVELRGARGRGHRTVAAGGQARWPSCSWRPTPP